MKFLMVSNCGEGAQILYRIQEEGNDVRLSILHKEYRKSWEGLLPQSGLGNSFIDKDTIIIFDFSGMGEAADDFRKSGHKVFGGSRFADKLEEDRAFGLNFMSKNGIKFPKTKEFDVTELEEARKYIEASEEKLVFKPSGEGLPCHLTYCSEDGEDLIRFIEYAYQYYEADIESFVLQDFMEGDLISTELYFDGKKAVYPANHTIEAKKFLAGDLGPSTGCSGNLVWAEFEDCHIINEGVGRIEEDLIKEGYCGPIDLNAIVTNEAVYGLEWTPRFGYDAICSFLPLIEGDLGKFFADMASGKGSMRLRSEFSAGVRFSIPPYPIEPEHLKIILKESPNLGIPIRGFNTSDVKDIYFYEIMLDDNDELVHSDGVGAIGVSNYLSDDPKDAFEGAYEIISHAKIPGLQYRNDLHKVIPKMYEKIEQSEVSHA